MSPDPKQVEALTALLEEAGLDASDLLTAITTLASAKKAVIEKVEKTGDRKNVINKELVYPDEKAIIYQRGDVKSNVYYFRTYDKLTKKQYVKSLDTTDRVEALATARNLFQEIQGKIQRNERIKSIKTEELIEIHNKDNERRITDTPHLGITPASFTLKRYYLRKWQEFIDASGYTSTPIDRIPKLKLLNFGMWYYEQPKKSGPINKPRSTEQINNAIGEVLKMYHKTAVRQRYISLEQIPIIERLKESKDTSYKRDILTEEQYDKFWRYMEYTYQKGKKIDENGNKVNDSLALRDKDELYKRQIFNKAMGILYNTGLRPKELLGLKWSEITTSKSDDAEARKHNYRIFVRADNSKTGKSRVIVCPVKRRFDVIKSCYKKMGVEVKPDDYVFMNPNNGRRPFTRQTYYQRLQVVLRHSGLEEELAKEGKSLTLYSSRHFFISMRLRYGKVPLYLLSRVAGTSVKNLTDTYGNIDTELEASVITRNMGRMVEVGFDMDKDVRVEEDISFTSGIVSHI
jgi:integrase